MVGAVGGEADQRVLRERGCDDGDVREVGAARVRVIEHPAHPGLVVLLRDGRDRRGHRAEVHGDVLGLHDGLTARVEQRAGRVTALLDVGAVARADEHGAHLLAGRAERSGRDAQGHGIEAHRVIRIVPEGSTSPGPAGGHGQRRLAQLDDRGAFDALAGLRLAADDLRLAVERVARGPLGAFGRLAHGVGVDLRPGVVAVARNVTSSTSASGSR